MVGTPAETVGRWRAMMFDSGSACRNCWGMIMSAPVRKQPYGVPHALAWNMGTMESTESRSLIPSDDPEVMANVCRKVDR